MVTPEQEIPADDVGEPADSVQRSWQFIGHEPTVEQVRQLLATLPDVWGLAMVEFEQYVQALPSKMKVTRPNPQNPRVMVTDNVEAWTLYMTVAGRIAMLQSAQEAHNWTVTIEPEPGTQIPGLLQHGDGRIVYREYVTIEHHDGRMIGRRPGMAWVPFSGGSAAAGSNPYEKVETAARGRALGAWGFGVLPGSGIATLEEMQGVAANAAALAGDAPTAAGAPRAAGRMTREQLLPRVKALVEEVRTKRGNSAETADGQVANYLSNRLGVENVQDPETGAIVWASVKDGQLQLLATDLQQTLLQIQQTEGKV